MQWTIALPMIFWHGVVPPTRGTHASLAPTCQIGTPTLPICTPPPLANWATPLPILAPPRTYRQPPLQILHPPPPFQLGIPPPLPIRHPPLPMPPPPPTRNLAAPFQFSPLPTPPLQIWHPPCQFGRLRQFGTPSCQRAPPLPCQCSTTFLPICPPSSICHPPTPANLAPPVPTWHPAFANLAYTPPTNLAAPRPPNLAHPMVET